jgi:DNA ligase 4
MLAGKKKIDYFKTETRSFYLETKYDGERQQVHFSRDQIKLFSRNGVDNNMVYEDLIAVLKDSIQADACILDGEIIVVDKEEHKMMPFGLNKSVAVGHETENLQLCFKVFDILWLKVENEEMNLMGYPLR